MKNTGKTSERTMPDWSKALAKEIIRYLAELMADTMAMRIVALVLICAKVPVWVTSELSGFCTKTVYKLQKLAKECRFSELFSISGGGRPSKLADIKDNLFDILDSENFYSYKAIVQMIKDRFDIDVSVSAVSRLLKKHGYKKYRSGSLPAKADAERQREFYETILLPLMKMAEEVKDVVLLFMDAAHFVCGCDYLGAVYSKTRRFLRTFSGRQRNNVLAAIDFVTKEIIAKINDEYINAGSVCNLLHKLAEIYTGKVIYIVLDNARYQRCAAITKCLNEIQATLGVTINLVYLPSYSPNLNLIERLWKFVKSELRQKYYSDFNEFKARILEILASVDTTNHDRICRLISKNIQLYDGLKPIDCHTLVSPEKEAKAS